MSEQSETPDQPLLPNSVAVLDALGGTSSTDPILIAVGQFFRPHHDRAMALETLKHPEVSMTADQIRATTDKLAAATITMLRLTREVNAVAARRVAHITPAPDARVLAYQPGEWISAIVHNVLISYGKKVTGVRDPDKHLHDTCDGYNRLCAQLYSGELTLPRQPQTPTAGGERLAPDNA
ncbi:hypothetical protein [Nocardia terpenica]|uniref:Uncharacterized protein n=1 Tax=Nocardia terpenica TaxID=455432 RepID=A0A164H3A9_9NOCA|nr:hypothetical protein [Nocardia terpenica]KZM68165.1 hypothetical protein AWN90_09500 [Nocardia terpenica]NQE88975.1 hypothetical protein [Nocardia terpenica]